MRVVITTSTLPVSDKDPVPSFVKDQAIELKKLNPSLEVVLHAPHNAYSKTSNRTLGEPAYKEVRFHYFWPKRWELLTGRAIMPALKKNRLLYLQIPFFCVAQFFSLLKLVRKERPDIIYAHWFMPQAINAAFVSLLTKTPYAFTTHASDVSVLRKAPFSKPLIRWVCKKANFFTAVSERTEAKIRHFFTPQQWEIVATKYKILPMGVSTDTNAIQKVDAHKVLTQYKISEEKDYILFLGRLAEKKGIKYLLEAFAQLPEDTRGQLQLVIAGDGQLLDSLRKQVSILGVSGVVFTGYVSGSAKETLLAMAKYVCVPSIIDSSGDSEGFPVVLMEALARGKIVFASTSSGGELVLHSGKNGFLFPEKDAVSLMQLLQKARGLTLPQEANISKEAKKLAQHYSWPDIAQQHLDLLFP